MVIVSAQHFKNDTAGSPEPRELGALAVSNTADLFNSLFTTFSTLAILVGAVVLGLMIYLIIRFREKPSASEPEDAPILGRIPHARGKLKTLAISVTLSAIILGFLIFGTFSAIDTINTPPQECQNPPQPTCLVIRVFGGAWYWDFMYPQGHTERGLLRVPVGTSVRLDVTSRDLFHSFGIIDFKIKTDAIPGRTNTIWFTANEVRSYLIACFELCGTGHAFMTATLQVMQPSDFLICCGSF